MTDLEKLKEVFLNQQERGIKSGDWPECECEKVYPADGTLELKVASLKVTFVFNKNGRFAGAYNWKE
jgi:hypothetical protein